MINKVDLLRTEIKKLVEKREEAILEKGLAAEENKDLRENFAYDYWYEREMVLTARINHIIKEISSLTMKKSTENAKKTKEKKEVKVKDLPKNKWY